MFRTRIRELRESDGFKSQQSFANAFGVAQSTVGNWEAGTREPNYEMAQKLANFFHVSVDYLLGREDVLRTFPTGEPWRKDQEEDYRNAKSDNERMRMLSIFGYDKARENEAKRLFPKQFNVIPMYEKIGDVVSFPIVASVCAGYNGLAVEEYAEETEEIPVSMFKGYSASEVRVFRVSGESMYPRFLDGDKVLVHIQEDVDDGEVAVVLYNGDEATLKKVNHIPGGVELIPYNPEYQTKRITGADAKQVRIFGKVLKLIRDV